MPCFPRSVRLAHPWLLIFALLTSADASAESPQRPSGAETRTTSLEPRALEAIQRFEARWKATRTATYRMSKRERMRDGETVHETVLVKLRRPDQVYMKRLKPREGQEVLYDAGRNPKQLTAHPGRFPDLTLNLDIHGGLATKGQHHTVNDAGYQQVVDILRSGLELARKKPSGEHLRYLGTRHVFGRDAGGIELQAGQTKGRRVRAKDDESLFRFAERVGMDAYVIYTANPSIDDLTDDLDDDESYLVPAYYGHRTRIWFDKATGLPLQVTIWDEKDREYEHYEHHELEVGVPLDAADFSEDNPHYDF